MEHPEPETIPCALAPNPIYHSYEAVETYKVYRGAGPPRVENLKYLTCAQPTLLPDYFIALAYTLEHPEPETIPCALAPNPIYHSYEAVEPPPLPQLIKIHAFPLWGFVFPRIDMLEWLTPGIPSKHIIRSGGLKVLDRPHLRSVKSIFWILSLPAPLATPAWPWSLTACRKKQKRHPRLLPDYLLALDNTLENPWPDGWPRETKRAGFVRFSTLRLPLTRYTKARGPGASPHVE